MTAAAGHYAIVLAETVNSNLGRIVMLVSLSLSLLRRARLIIFWVKFELLILEMDEDESDRFVGKVCLHPKSKMETGFLSLK